MKKVSYLLAVVAILGLAGFAMAAKGGNKGHKGNKAPAGLAGKITALDGAKVTVTAKTGPVDYTVVTEGDAKTVITVDGVGAALADLKVGMTVTVTPETAGPAATIAAKMAAAHKGGKKGNK
jgi:hypothetical protein